MSTATPVTAWEQALAAFEAARLRHEQFLAAILDPAVRAAQAQGLGLTPQLSALEDEGNELCGSRYDALHVLAAAPAPDLPALLVKLRHVYQEALRHEDSHGMAGAILADLERLLS
ncbi:hypothetical protein SZ64_10540 [Erythrobacter sp. SG61-1L]|uniref:hypothetical protein n=1 Tax=Erythrobacter sp. SG61-1L TaxID=1603897 RepID=UPI0006C9219E|nr:hypothetical protein [Erythrobacter sp. SG61-1L]KPL68501.1 hypothetical protein SZ64_10540 [Erythrobacter sp. SG61-1L]